MKKIPFSSVSFDRSHEDYVLDALRSSWVSGGPYVDQLEGRIADKLGCRNAIAVANGTAAIEVVLRGYGIGPGDEVLIPGFCFLAAASMTVSVGATPVFVDVDEETWGFDLDMLRSSITERTSAIIAVHAYGPMDRMEDLRQIADDNGLLLVEDAAEAVFSSLNGRWAGSFGHAGTFSFHATKTLATGEGGMVVTDDDELTHRMRLYRSHGRDASGPHYWHTVPGHNFRLSNILAALGCAQMDRLESTILKRERIYSRYKRNLQNVGGLAFQPVIAGCDPVIWSTTVRLGSNVDRDNIMAQLLERGVETRPGFYPVSQLPVLSSPSLPVSERISASALVLPTHMELSDSDVDYVCRTLSTCIAAPADSCRDD